MQGTLAIHGGCKVKSTPFGTGKRFGLEEVRELVEALEQDTLFYHAGEKVKTFLARFNELYGITHSVAASSGTAAIHVALGAAGVTVGDEVITSPITDQGTLIGILYQNAIPVFADLHPRTYNLDAASVERRITSRTKAILVVHLAGTPADMDPIMEVARRHDLAVIEDCAQSYLARYKGRLAGTIGNYGCFSTNDFKHISTGDGGIVTVNSGQEEEYRTVHAFADKNYQRLEGEVFRDLDYLAPNYRMTELQGAVGIAQLKKLPWICGKRNEYGERLTEQIREIPGILPPQVPEGSRSSYWFYLFRLDPAQFRCDRDTFTQALREEGIPAHPGYIPRVVYQQPLFQNKQAYLHSSFPFDRSPDVSYDKGLCPEAEAILETSIRLPVSEFFTPGDIDEMAEAIRKVAAYYRR
ncbi:aminotransferase DegT [Marinithermofilum abyssi]|uniref:Aminotransferase DegT n=1 Tax=Marinithermofilum abyssi TaxID=1571185 RepID=A0A8J2YDK2_9BACL|nr:DegT/DnrJ/EryC1/StrS family aminotransferase [Marinithermofilum abyssi]GGE26274.1 aminotransferase DegT [Marinithermofilum abyssi]